MWRPRLRTLHSYRSAAPHARARPEIGFDPEALYALLKDIEPHVQYVRNVSQPIMRLPSEVLFRIFGMLQQQELPVHPIAENTATAANPLRWQKVSRVCSLWRRLASSCPSLWTSIDISGLCPGERPVCSSIGDYAQFYLQRSAGQPLSVSLTLTSDDDAHHDVLKHLSHTRNLYVCAYKIVDAHTDFLAQPVPVLQTLVIDARRAAFDGVPSALGVFLRKDHPSLRSLALRSLIIDDTVHGENLCQLYFSSIRCPTSEAYQTVVSMLSTMPNLEDLQIERAEFPVGTEDVASLPYLKRLVLNNNIGTSILFASLSLTREVCVTCNTTPSSPGVFPEDRSKLGDLQRLKKVKMNFTGRDCLKVVALADASAFQGTLHFDYGGFYFFEQYRALVDNVEELWLEGRIAYITNHDILLHGFAQARNLQKIILALKKGLSLSRVIRALIPLSNVPCHAPELKELTICGPQRKDYKPVLTLLRTRSERACPIRRLQVCNGISPDAETTAVLTEWSETGLEALQALVDEVQITTATQSLEFGSRPVCHERGAGVWEWPAWEEL